MPKCGLCGFYARHAEEADGGDCLWRELRRYREEVWDVTDCDEYLSRLPGLDPYEHIEWRKTRSALAQTLRDREDRDFNRTVAVISTLLAILSFISGWFIL